MRRLPPAPTEIPESPEDLEDPADPSAGDAIVVPLNDAGAVFDALAREIRGSAVGWTPEALHKLEIALVARYGPVIGGSSAVKRLLAIATEPSAA